MPPCVEGAVLIAVYTPLADFPVQQGVVLNKAFHRFRVEAVADEEQGKRMLANAGVGHYFDLAKNFQPAA